MLDVQLGKLARYLRLCGFDALYRNDYDDADVATIAAEENRILLTRDRDVLKRRIVTHGCFVRSDRPREQLGEVLRRFDLHDQVTPFTRCSRCNGLLRDIDKAGIEYRLEPLTRRYYQHFRICTACGRLYWEGSHVPHIERLLARIRERGSTDGDR
ncbi:MAG: Mut7-C RNAse domain-containing protein [Halofilum sp. (in: g-proteobacteria)]|nr:Mut7-C RNAse domain-containing protein [Halofilum sp. (in: g-proteobacteria)]